MVKGTDQGLDERERQGARSKGKNKQDANTSEDDPNKAKQKHSYRKWPRQDDQRLLNCVQDYINKEWNVNWKDIGRRLRQHPRDCKKRYQYLERPAAFTYEEEDKIVDIATKYFDSDEVPNWELIGKQVRGKPAELVEKKYYEVMKEYWNEPLTAQLLEMVQRYKTNGEEVDWKEIGKKLSGRPPRVVAEWYEIQQQKKKL